MRAQIACVAVLLLAATAFAKAVSTHDQLELELDVSSLPRALLAPASEALLAPASEEGKSTPVKSQSVGVQAAAAAAAALKQAPKLYLYAWCGVSYKQQAAAPNGDNTDYIATIDATPGSTKYGRILSVASTPYAGTEAHHCNVDKTGRWLGTGGLLAFTKPNTPDIYMFDLTNPAEPKYKHGYTSGIGSCMDEFLADVNGGYYVSSMCGRDGHPGGGVMRITDPSRNTMDEYNGGMDTPEKKASFASHGVDIDYGSRRMVTADFLDVVTAVKQNPQPKLGLLHTAHVWDIDSMKVIKSVDLSGITAGLMESRFTGTTGLFWVSGGLGALHLVDALTFNATPNVYCLDKDCSVIQGTCLSSKIFDEPRGKRMLVSSSGLSQLRLVDVNNPRELVTLDIYQLPAGAGAHVVKYDKNTQTAALATYLLNINGPIDTVDALKSKSDQSIHLFKIDLDKDKIVPQEPGVIDFKTAVAAKGPSNCHGLAFNYRS